MVSSVASEMPKLRLVETTRHGGIQATAWNRLHEAGITVPRGRLKSPPGSWLADVLMALAALVAGIGILLGIYVAGRLSETESIHTARLLGAAIALGSVLISLVFAWGGYVLRCLGKLVSNSQTEEQPLTGSPRTLRPRWAQYSRNT
jgi:hypothetical protein